MVDVVDAATRSRMMAGIRGKNTSPERMLRAALTALGARYRIHFPAVPGRPDVVFAGSMLAVFVQGCFWHGCPRHYQAPATRSGFWRAKLETNRARDRRVRRRLQRLGWTSLWFWEHQVKADAMGCARRVLTLRARLLRARPPRPARPPSPTGAARRSRSGQTRAPSRPRTRTRPGRTGTVRPRAA